MEKRSEKMVGEGKESVSARGKSRVSPPLQFDFDQYKLPMQSSNWQTSGTGKK